MSKITAKQVVCPLCERGFTAILDVLNCRIDGYAGRWERTVCPKCDTELLVSDIQDSVLFAEDITGFHEGILLRGG